MDSDVARPPDGEELAAAVQAPTVGAVATGVSWKVLSVTVGQGFWYGSLFVLAALIQPRDFGIIAVGSAVVAFTLIVLESGAGGSLIIARNLAPSSIRRAFAITSLAGLLGTAVFAGLATPIAKIFADGADPSALRVLSIIVVIAAVAIVPNALLSKHLRFQSVAKLTIAASAVASVIAIVAGALGAGVWALVIRLLVNQIIITALTLLAARDLLPRRSESADRVARPPAGRAFLMIAGAAFLAWTFDNLVVGAFTDAQQLGLYSLAFSLAFAPLTQVSWAVGQVVLPAVAAARDEEMVRRQTLKAVRMMALVLLPLLPVACALAPGLIPGVLGHKWEGMVVPFEILVVVGICQGVVNILGEALAGAGVRSVRMRAQIDVTWAVATIIAIVIGVNLDGIRGAAIAHVFTFCGLAAAYAWRGRRGIDLPIAALLGAVSGVAGCVAVQGVITAAVCLGLHALTGGWLVAGLVGAALGALAFALVLRGRAPALYAEGRGVLTATLSRTGR
ncbi:MAG: oligosaccharide flippase family protein [Solirubrobacteraceae bacterium]